MTKSIQYASTACIFLLTICSNSLTLADSRPNVILIYTDDQGFGDASCLNPDTKFQTPNIDRLAKEGMTFTDAHCSDTVCTPSRYGLLTGRYSWRTTLKKGVYGAEKTCLIADGRTTLPSLLKQRGYATAMVGKWHLGMNFPGDRGTRDWSKPVLDMPLDKGFDYFWGIPASMNYGVLAWFEGRYAKVPPTEYTQKKPNKIALADYRIKPPYDQQLSEPGTTSDLGVVRGQLEIAPDFVDSECLTRFTDKAIEWVEGHAETSRQGEPFFLYLPYTSPHKPVIPIDQFRGKSDAGAYGDFMMETDWHVGRILEMLDREKLTENTMVIFTSDNGPETTWKERGKKFSHQSNGIYRDGKRSIYEGGHRVPMFIRWPAKISPASQCNQPICQTDILATLAAITENQLAANEGEDSFSFAPVLTNPNARMNRVPMIHHSASGGFAIRDGDWKLVMETPKSKRQLYNLATDPGERNNVLQQHSDVAQKLHGQITEIVLNGRSTTGPKQANDTPWWNHLIWMDKF